MSSYLQSALVTLSSSRHRTPRLRNDFKPSVPVEEAMDVHRAWVSDEYWFSGSRKFGRRCTGRCDCRLIFALASGVGEDSLEVLCVYINYDCDRRRQEIRETNDKSLVWGKAPSKIVASYTTESGETKTSLLLTSGWWGLARHFRYVPEISAPFFWTVPALFNHRDDDRCQSKYGKYWKMYCKKVPNRIVPRLY